MRASIGVLSLLLVSSMAIVVSPGIAQAADSSKSELFASFPPKKLEKLLEKLDAQIAKLTAQIEAVVAKISESKGLKKLVLKVKLKDLKAEKVALEKVRMKATSHSVPEPLTVLGTASALGVGLLLRKSYLKANSESETTLCS